MRNCHDIFLFMVMVGLVRVNGLVRVVRLFGVVGDGGGGGVVDGQGIQVVWVDGTPDGWGDQVDRGCQYLKAPRAVKSCPLKVGGTPCTAFCFKALTVVSIQKISNIRTLCLRPQSGSIHPRSLSRRQVLVMGNVFSPSQRYSISQVWSRDRIGFHLWAMVEPWRLNFGVFQPSVV